MYTTKKRTGNPRQSKTKRLLLENIASPKLRKENKSRTKLYFKNKQKQSQQRTAIDIPQTKPCYIVRKKKKEEEMCEK